MPIPSRAYKDAIHLLNSLQSNAATIEAIRKSGGKLNEHALVEMRDYLGRVGYKPTDLNRLNAIHITGTKGKGSTSAFCDSILRSLHRHHPPPDKSQKLKVGLYTSPHLVAVRERIRINGVPLSEDLFAKYFFEVWDALDRNPPRSISSSNTTPSSLIPPAKPVYFRYLTLLAFHAFLSQRVDTTILEVGVGGAFDSTNIVPAPLTTGVTSLGLDHTALLGNTLGEVAWNKAGIYKEGVKALSVEQKEEGMEVLRRRARELGTDGFQVVPVRKEVDELKLGLAGHHQKTNASLSLALISDLLSSPSVPSVLSHIPKFPSSGPLPPALKEGLERARWPGRCQLVREGSRRWWLDGAHTVESLEGCGEWFWEEIVREKAAERILIFNCTNGRSSPSLLASLFSRAPANSSPSSFFSKVIFCTNTTYASGESKGDLTSTITSDLAVQEEIASAYRSLFPSSPCEVLVLGSIEEAVDVVKQASEKERGRKAEVDVLVAGSLHLVGGVMEVAGLGREEVGGLSLE